MVSSAVAVTGGEDPFPTDLAAGPTDVVMVGRNARMAALTQHCGALSWRCVGDAAGQPWPSVGGEAAWGVVKPSHADAAQSAVGLLGLLDHRQRLLGLDGLHRRGPGERRRVPVVARPASSAPSPRTVTRRTRRSPCCWPSPASTWWPRPAPRWPRRPVRRRRTSHEPAERPTAPAGRAGRRRRRGR